MISRVFLLGLFYVFWPAVLLLPSKLHIFDILTHSALVATVFFILKIKNRVLAHFMLAFAWFFFRHKNAEAGMKVPKYTLRRYRYLIAVGAVLRCLKISSGKKE